MSLIANTIVRTNSRSLLPALALSTNKTRQSGQPSRRHLSQRSWNVVRYHPDLKQAIQFEGNSHLPTVYKPNDILVKVLASSVNPLDIAMSRGYGNVLLTLSNILMSTGIDRLNYDRLPLTLGRDFVGQIVARGSSVSLFKPGDLVWGTVPPYENGAHADFVITSDNAVAHKPQNLSNVEAASIPYVGLTAWSAISTFGELSATNSYNKKILVLGGSGGVGAFAIQLLKYWGADVTTTCSSASMDWLKSLTNVEECIDYKDAENFLRTYPGTFDFILDASSSNASRKNYEILTSVLNRNRSSQTKGVLNPRTMYVTLTSPLLRNFDQKGALTGAFSTVADAISDTLSGLQHGLSFRWAYYLPNPKALAHIGDLVERGAIKPLTTAVFEFDKAMDAYESMEKRPLSGKVVLNCSN